MVIDLKIGLHRYHTNNGGILTIKLYEVDIGKLRADIVPDPDNIDLNGFDTATAFIFSVGDRDNQIPGTNIILHYDPRP